MITHIGWDEVKITLLSWQIYNYKNKKEFANLI